MKKQRLTAKSFFSFISWGKSISASTLKADLLAGLTGAIIVLPQGVAYAMIAGLPPEYGLYTAIIPAVVAALFGSSHHLISGPTAALSVIVFTTVNQFAAPGSDLYIQLAISLTLFAGIVQLVLGLLRFGAVVNFVSHSVVLGFTAGAAIVISASQIKHMLGLNYPSGATAVDNLVLGWQHLNDFHIAPLLIGVVTILTCIVIKDLSPRLPYMLIAMMVSMALAFSMNGAGFDISLVGEVSGGLPPFFVPDVSAFPYDSMISGVVAVALLGLVEAISIARSVALKSKQNIDSNKEFIGQGLSNIAGSFFSCYVSSGSFTRSGVNYASGAKTPLAAVFAAIFLAVIMLFFAKYAAYIPIAGMAGILLVVAFNLIDVPHILDVVRHDRKEAIVLASTCIAALTMHLELSIYVGVAVSLFFYLRRTSRPVVDHLDCEELAMDKRLNGKVQVVRINGSIFFGSVQHLHSELQRIDTPNIIILGRGINFIDHLGVRMLAEFSQSSGKQVFFCRFKNTPRESLLKGDKTFSERQFYPSLTRLMSDMAST
ncbi:putative SULFATE TRANSPORTER [Vibrio nigripulchritudo MADA3029]|uniref:SulP family inorganic anion transporter n=1 Tax=Vibrio nigripulchritudo TaxID=28173 RepID=UPI0003B1A347|nr:SulP family inorganic anion transporter [Vibrio nigripulchritudo]CCN45563.1 putative SULFATE TRANSPORTER [Vibrio nigripulchritudo MADA3020]CCN55816.1 putative SULFATE TRANSPORTER [Vibrio nigripulchritudo MADA3021]CCN57040.1 putative SULFATE TRANSPORTER [Vibrio nigripulchritudo MADA3029]